MNYSAATKHNFTTGIVVALYEGDNVSRADGRQAFAVDSQNAVALFNAGALGRTSLVNRNDGVCAIDLIDHHARLGFGHFCHLAGPIFEPHVSSLIVDHDIKIL